MKRFQKVQKSNIHRSKLGHYYKYGYILDDNTDFLGLNKHDSLYLEKYIEEKVHNKDVVVWMSGGIDSGVIAYLCRKHAKNVTGMMIQMSYWDRMDITSAQNKCDELNIKFIGVYPVLSNYEESFYEWCLSYPLPFAGSATFNSWEILTEVSKNYGELIVTGFGTDQICNHISFCDCSQTELKMLNCNYTDVLRDLYKFSKNEKTANILTSVNQYKWLFEKISAQYDIEIYSPWLTSKIQNMNKIEFYKYIGIPNISDMYQRIVVNDNVKFLIAKLERLFKKYNCNYYNNILLTWADFILKVWCTENNVEIDII